MRIEAVGFLYAPLRLVLGYGEQPVEIIADAFINKLSDLPVLCLDVIDQGRGSMA
ncbi:hypothetical protein D3C79_1108430 [compost metagenome]